MPTGRDGWRSRDQSSDPVRFALGRVSRSAHAQAHMPDRGPQDLLDDPVPGLPL